MIGIFDSGVGGLSIYKEIKKIFPKEKCIYFADTKNFPYGEKSNEELIKITKKAVETLIESGATIIVVACNSATVSVIKKLREKFALPIFGIEPAIKVAAGVTDNGNIGVIATKRTVTEHSGEDYLKENQRLFKVYAPGLVDLVENNFDQITPVVLKESVNELIENDVDVIALGCTHYHFLSDKFAEIYPNVKFIAPDEAVAKRVANFVNTNMLKFEHGKDLFLVSSDVEEFRNKLKKLLNIEDSDVRKV